MLQGVWQDFCPSALLLLHDQEVSLASKFPKVFFHKKTSPGFRKKPPVSLSGTPPGRPWTKQETNNSTIQMASSFPKKTQRWFDDRCRFAVEFAWIFCCPMWSSYCDNNPPPPKKSKTEEREEPNNKRRIGSGSWLFRLKMPIILKGWISYADKLFWGAFLSTMSWDAIDLT